MPYEPFLLGVGGGGVVFNILKAKLVAHISFPSVELLCFGLLMQKGAGFAGQSFCLLLMPANSC